MIAETAKILDPSMVGESVGMPQLFGSICMTPQVVWVAEHALLPLSCNNIVLAVIL